MVERNTARADYVGPRACGGCHAEQYAAWQHSLHRVMNAKVEDAGAVIGDFATTLAYAGGQVTFAREGHDYVMAMRASVHEVRYRVTRTIGRRGLQEYVGIEDGKTEEVRLPFGWWPRGGGWYAQPYFDPWLDEARFDPYAPVHEPWAERCPWCHSTYPFELRIARASGPSRLGHGLEQLFASPTANRDAGGDRLDVAAQITTGISCESCHLGGRAHADGGPIHLVPQGAPSPTPLPAQFVDERRDAAIVNAVCAQCHSGPSPRLADGTALRNSSEALDLGASPCTGIKCTDCHDPHRADAKADDARAIAACIGCHQPLADPAAARSHAGAGHSTTTCLDCHMPRIVMGIDRFVRTHRISSPTDAKLYAVEAPNACNLCHLDRSAGWTLDALRAGWDVRVRTTPRGDPDGALGERWLASTTPAIRLIAAHAYGRSPLGKGELAELTRGLDDPLPYVRVWTRFAIEDVLGRRLRAGEYDPRVRPARRLQPAR
jgi:predicted CXXCH cytochrome family protein